MKSSDLTGVWELVYSENFGAFLKEIDASLEQKENVFQVNPIVEISQLGEVTPEWVIRTKMGSQIAEQNFIIDVPFEEELVNGKVAKCIMFFHENPDRLMLKSNIEGLMITISRTIHSFGRLRETMNVNDVVAFRDWKRLR